MRNIQRVNEAAKNLKMSVIATLIKEDYLSCKAKLPITEELAHFADSVYALEVPTWFLADMFSYCRRWLNKTERESVPVNINHMQRYVDEYKSHFNTRFVRHPFGVKVGTVGYDSEERKELTRAIKEEHCLPTTEEHEVNLIGNIASGLIKRI